MYIPISLLRRNERENFLSPRDIEKKQIAIQDDSARELDGSTRFLQRRAMLAAVAPESLDVAFERYIGDNDLLPINYLQLGTMRSRAVGRLRYLDRRVNRNGMATGFLISPGLVLTNHHVFGGPQLFSNPLIDFDYAYDIDGNEMDKITFRLDPAKFFYTNEALDSTLIGIEETDETGAHHIRERGYLVLNPAPGKAGIGDYATIIQYPDGNYQQIALRQNKVLQINPNAVIYETDTSPGSSGSPAFNDQWQVFALHSAGVAKKNDSGQYIDKDNKPIPVVNGQIDSSQIVWESNTGIRVSSLVADWLSQPTLKGNPALAFLSDPAYSDAKEQNSSQPAPATTLGTESTVASTPNPTSEPMDLTLDPARSGTSITINVNLAGQATPPVVVSPVTPVAPQPTAVAAPVAPAPSPASTDTESFESKLEQEQAKDFSSYNGFDDHFMGDATPLPLLGTQLARQAAYLVNNPRQNVLKYEHYSTIVHSIRRVPLVSAVNVEGDPSVRRDQQPRKDNWLRDNRIDLDVQLTDDYYVKSGFDKGHMSRREDAKWGETAAEAEEAAQLTCMYSNACPQVPAINRAVYGYHGLWGQLEQIVLEKGVVLEHGDASKICVFNGPIFVSTDPTYKGVQVAMRFYKLVVWRNGAGEMKATAFILSQEDLVGGIQFEELQYDKEFIEHQCSIAYLEKQTDLTFAGISQWDTHPDSGDNEAVATVDRAAVEAHIESHSGKPGAPAKTASKRKPAARPRKPGRKK